MKKIFLFVAAICCTMAINAAAPALQSDTLDNSAAVLVGEQISYNAGTGAIEWNDNQPGCSATWEYSLVAGKYDVILNQTTGSGHNFTFAVMSGESEVASVGEGANSWASGDISLGKITIEADGEYSFILTNATEWSAADAQWVIFKLNVPDPTEYTVEPGEGTLSAALASAEDGYTYILKTGEYVEASSIAINKNITIKAGEDEEPVIKAGSHFTLNNGGLAIYDVKMDAAGEGDYLISVEGNDAMNIVLSGCEICNYKKYMLNINHSNHVDTVLIDDCYIHDMTRTVIYCYENDSENKLPGCSYFEMTNSTVANMGNPGGVANIFIRNNTLDTEKANEPEVYLSNVTFFNVQAPYGVVKTDGGDVTIENTIFAKTADGVKALSLAKSGIVNNCLFFETAKGGEATFTDCIEDEDPLFVDVTDANYQLAWNSPAIGAGIDGVNLGDPRWGVEERPALEEIVLDNSAAVLVGPQISYNAESGAIEWLENKPGCSATWTMNLVQGDYAVVINQTTGSGHQFKVEIAFAGGAVINSVAEPAGSWDAGDITLEGVLYAPAESETQYTLTLTNEMEWSAADAQTVTLKRYEYSGSWSALNKVKTGAKAVKAVRNGMIVIERNGVRYNVLGAKF